MAGRNLLLECAIRRSFEDTRDIVKELAIYCADIGSITKNFGWARVSAESEQVDSGTRIDDVAERLSTDIAAGRPVALGFECPLWVPLPTDGLDLGKARPRETGPGRRSRPWSAAAGASALVAGLVQVPWLLEKVRPAAGRERAGTTDWAAFRDEKAGFFIWEAMVTDSAKGECHEDDARIGALTFKTALPDPRATDACPPAGPVYSLAGAALLRSGWSTDLQDLKRPCLVIRAA